MNKRSNTLYGRMKMQITFHKRTGISPGFGVSREYYGKACTVYILRLWWSALCLTFYREYKK